MTDEQPNLAAMSPQQASERLSQLAADESWRTAYLSGSGPHRKDFDLLMQRAAVDDRIDNIVANAGTNVPGAPGGASANVGGVSPQDVRTAAGWLHDAGVSDGAIAELLRSEAVSDENYRNLVEPWVKENMVGNADWVKRLMAGGATERKQLLAWGIIKTNRKGAAAPTVAGR